TAQVAPTKNVGATCSAQDDRARSGLSQDSFTWQAQERAWATALPSKLGAGRMTEEERRAGTMYRAPTGACSFEDGRSRETVTRLALPGRGQGSDWLLNCGRRPAGRGPRGNRPLVFEAFRLPNVEAA